jgi:hypothetical protein
MDFGRMADAFPRLLGENYPARGHLSALHFGSIFPRMKTSNMVIVCLALNLAGAQAQNAGTSGGTSQSTGKIEAPEGKDLAPTPSAGSGGDCPQNRYYLKVEGDIGPADFYGNYWPGSGLGGGGDYSLGMGLGVKLVYCSDTVMSMVPE